MAYWQVRIIRSENAATKNESHNHGRRGQQIAMIDGCYHTALLGVAFMLTAYVWLLVRGTCEWLGLSLLQRSLILLTFGVLALAYGISKL